MRPTLLTLENINSFREEQTVDFASLASGGNIFCISGDTGSGKSTIFAAMMLALYNNTPKKGANLADYINLSTDKARVALTFEADGDVYETVRFLARKGTPKPFTLKKNGEPIATGGEAFAKIEEIVGLEQEQFTQVALLEQGKFDKFLDSKPAERAETLRKLLDLERYGKLISIVNGMNDEVKTRLNELTTVLDRMEREGKTADNLKICKAAVKTLTADVEKLKKERDALSEKLTAEEGRRKLHEEIVRITKSLALSKLACDAGAAKLAALTAKCADPDKELTELTRLEQQLEGVRKLKTDLGRELAQKNEYLRKSREDYRNTRAEFEKLQKELDDSLAGDMDGAVALILSNTKPGDKCPVCGGNITAHADKGGKVSDRAEKEKKLAALYERVGNILADGKRCKAETDALEARIAAEVTPHSDVDAAINDARRKANALNADRLARKAAETELTAAKATYDTLLAELSKKGRDDYDEAQGKALAARAAECAAELESKLKSLSANEKSVADITAALAEADGLKKELKDLNARQRDIATLVELFKFNRFGEYVTEEYIKDFTVSASAVLHRLSGGNYTLEYRDKDFWIKDFLNENKERKVKTLSGGETFLASMSLAIAIMQYISAGKSIEFFFLDEGFGTLHEEAVETVVGALRELAKDVTVGIISHVDNLVERMQSRVTVQHATDERGSVIVTQ